MNRKRLRESLGQDARNIFFLYFIIEETKLNTQAIWDFVVYDKIVPYNYKAIESFYREHIK